MGRGRGMLMLPDIQMLNALARVVILGAEKIIDPPLMLPDDGFIVPIKRSPGSLNYYRAGTRPTDRIAPIETHANIPVGLDLLTRVESKIERGFFNNLLLSRPIRRTRRAPGRASRRPSPRASNSRKPGNCRRSTRGSTPSGRRLW
jgi:hypothetical protein